MTQSRISIEQLEVKRTSSSSFLIKHFNQVESRDGKPYINVILADATGELEARIWSSEDQLPHSVNKGDICSVSGKLNIFQGRKQFIINDIVPLEPSAIDMEEYLSKSHLDSDQMFNELMEIVLRLDEVYIKDLLKAILEDTEIQRRLKLWQAGKSIHHAYQSGLLEHILSCTRLGDTLSNIYNVNKSYVVAGCILHDLCKIYELSDGHSVDYTEEGKLVGHLVKGVELVDKYIYKAVRDFPHDQKLHLKHILLSHHGEYQYGSPKIPQTKEAMLVHLIDLMDSKMASFDEVIKKDNMTGHWTGFVKHLDRIVFKDALPSYTNKSNGQVQTNTPSKEPAKRGNSKPQGKELKQSLGDKLKDFKV